jgi:A/G-specific adenine glycosylase
MSFSSEIINWYSEHKRDLPWRKNPEPYPVWLSEIILQQTQISQGLPYYKKFISTFPSVHDLAKADEQQVLKLWQGLGYYSRARNLHTTARYVSEELNGIFPKDYQGLKKLKGVGDYTASAIASICFGEAKAVLDGNVFRVLSRYFGVDTPINSTEGKKQFKKIAEENLDTGQPSTHNQAMMEFGALHCKPKKPFCPDCPLNSKCVAFQQKLQDKLPIKTKKVKVKTKHFNYLVIKGPQNQTLLHHRSGKGIWKNLYQFPLLETEKEIFDRGFKSRDEIQAIQPLVKKIELFNNKPIKHLLSHRKLLVKFWIIDLEKLPKENWFTDFKITDWSEIQSFPVPTLIDKFLANFDFKG